MLPWRLRSFRRDGCPLAEAIPASMLWKRWITNRREFYTSDGRHQCWYGYAGKFGGENLSGRAGRSVKRAVPPTDSHPLGMENHRDWRLCIGSSGCENSEKVVQAILSLEAREEGLTQD
jgi:hypothetical protein